MMKRIINILTIVIISASFVIGIAWNILTPPGSDDFCYMAVCSDPLGFWRSEGADIETFAQAWESTKAHAAMINGRLANAIVIMLMPLPWWITDTLCGIFIGVFALVLALWGSRSGKGRISIWSAMLSTAAMWFCFQWYDYFQATDFQANYVWPSVGLVALLLLMPDWNRYGGTRRTLIVLLGLLVAWMHEAFAATMAAYFLIQAAVNKRNGRATSVPAAWWLFGASIAGLVLGVAGGTMERILLSVKPGALPFLSRPISRIAFELWPAYIAVSLLIIKILRYRTHWRAIALQAAPPPAAIAASITVALVTNVYDRALWPMSLFCVLLILDIVIPVLERIGPRVTAGAGTAFTIMYIAWGIQLCRYQGMIYDQHQAIESTMGHKRHSGDRGHDLYPYTSILTGKDIPSYLMDIPNNPLEDFWSNTRIGAWYTRRHTVVLPVLDSLARLPFDRWPRVPGDNDFRGVWPYVAIADTTGYRDPVATFGPLNNNATFADHLYSLYYDGADSLVSSIQLWPQAVLLPDSTTVYWCVYQARRRSTAHRELIRLDRDTAQMP